MDYFKDCGRVIIVALLSPFIFIGYGIAAIVNASDEVTALVTRLLATTSSADKRDA